MELLNTYIHEFIKYLEPFLNARHDLVIRDRVIHKMDQFPALKKLTVYTDLYS